jgi:hypothetical protein
MEPEHLLSSSQEHSTGLYPKQEQSSSYQPILPLHDSS